MHYLLLAAKVSRSQLCCGLSAPCDFLFKCAVYKYTYLLTYVYLHNMSASSWQSYSLCVDEILFHIAFLRSFVFLMYNNFLVDVCYWVSDCLLLTLYLLHCIISTADGCILINILSYSSRNPVGIVLRSAFLKSLYAFITIAIRLRYDYDVSRAPASIRRDLTRAKNEHANFSS